MLSIFFYLALVLVRYILRSTHLNFHIIQSYVFCLPQAKATALTLFHIKKILKKE